MLKRIKPCKGRSFLVKYGEWVEIYDLSGNLLISFKAIQDMCSDLLKRYLIYKLDKEPPEYKIKINRKGK